METNVQGRTSRDSREVCIRVRGRTEAMSATEVETNIEHLLEEAFDEEKPCEGRASSPNCRKEEHPAEIWVKMHCLGCLNTHAYAVCRKLLLVFRSEAVAGKIYCHRCNFQTSPEEIVEVGTI